VVLARQFLLHCFGERTESAIAMLSPDATYTVPGHNALAGTFSGRAEVVSHLGRVFTSTGGTLDTIQWEDWMGGVNYVSALRRLHVQIEHRLFKGRQIFLLAFNPDDAITSIRVYFDDQDLVDDVIGH